MYYGLSIAQLALGRPETAETFARVLILQPGAGWFNARLLDSQRIGVDTYAIGDATRYVESNGWDGGSSYVMFIAALAYQRLKATDKASETLKRSGLTSRLRHGRRQSSRFSTARCRRTPFWPRPHPTRC